MSHAIAFIYNAGWSSSEARRAHNPKVAGSNPAPATKLDSVEPPYQKSASTEFFDTFIDRTCFVDLKHKKTNKIMFVLLV